MISRRGFIAGLLSLPLARKLEPVAKAILPRLPGRLGVKGSAFVEAGFVWAPYIPLVVTETFLPPVSREEMKELYVKKAVRTEYYGTVKL